MWYDETIKNMAFQRDKVLGSCMTEDEEEAKMLNAPIKSITRINMCFPKDISIFFIYYTMQI